MLQEKRCSCLSFLFDNDLSRLTLKDCNLPQIIFFHENKKSQPPNLKKLFLPVLALRRLYFRCKYIKRVDEKLVFIYIIIILLTQQSLLDLPPISSFSGNCPLISYLYIERIKNNIKQVRSI